MEAHNVKKAMKVQVVENIPMKKVVDMTYPAQKKVPHNKMTAMDRAINHILTLKRKQERLLDKLAEVRLQLETIQRVLDSK